MTQINKRPNTRISVANRWLMAISRVSRAVI
jgi:hypothetical protein